MRTRAILVLCGLLMVACADPAAEWTRAEATTPTLFAPDVVSTSMREYGITFTPDGREAYFTRRARRGPGQIHVTRFAEGTWSEPVAASFALPRDEAPFIAPDGSRMYFASNRPGLEGLNGSHDIWVMDRGPEGWLEPSPLGGAVNRPEVETEDYTLGFESGPVLLGNGALLYWARSDPDWGSDLFVAEPGPDGAFLAPRALTINSFGDETSPAMSPDGRVLVFQGYRDATGPGEQDLYYSRKTDFGWSDPVPLPEPINSVGNDGYPSFTADGRFFFFASDREARSGYYDIYYMSVDALPFSAAETR